MGEQSEQQEPYFTVKQLAQRWGVTERAVQKWISQGEFPHAYRTGRGRASHYRVPQTDVFAFEKDRRVN